jgi:hypothetical protein
MIRVPAVVLLFCAVAAASPLSCSRDVFQSTGTFTSPQAYVSAPNSIDWNAYSFITNVDDVSEGVKLRLAPKIGGDETGASAARDNNEFGIVPDSFVPFDLSNRLPDGLTPKSRTISLS